MKKKLKIAYLHLIIKYIIFKYNKIIITFHKKLTFKHVTFKKIVYFHLITKYIIAKHDKIIIAFYRKQHLNMLLF
jgi:hypothetical protein